MSIIRVVKHPEGFTKIDNRTVRDYDLSFHASGVLGQLLSYPNDWVVSIAHLSKVRRKCGRTTVTNAINELREEGYILRVDYRYKGRFQTEYTVFDTRAAREAWMAVNNVEDGQVFETKPNFVIPELSDAQDPGEPKPRKSRKAPKTEEELQAEAAEKEAKAAERKRLKALNDEKKAEEKRLAKEKVDQDNAARYELFGSKERYTKFNKWYFGFYAPNSNLNNSLAFYNVVMNNLLAGGEKYRSIVCQFELEEKKEAKKLEAERQNAIATERAKTLEQQNRPVQDHPVVTQEPVAKQMSPKEFLRPDDLEWFESSKLQDDLLAGCIAELNGMKDHWVMHRSIISKYRKPQQARDLGLVSVNN